MLSFVELFAGSGSLHLSLLPWLNHDQQISLVYEPNDKALQVYQDNFAHTQACCHTIFTNDVKGIWDCKHADVCLGTIGSDDIVFSRAKQTCKKSLAKQNPSQKCSVKTDSSLDVVLKFCAHTLPKVLIMECSSKVQLLHQGVMLIKIEQELSALGYQCTFKILNSQEFGVPHNKNRLYIVALREELHFPWNDFELPVKAPDHYQHLKCCLKDILEDEPVEQRYFVSSHYLSSLAKSKHEQEQKGGRRGMLLVDLNGSANSIVKGAMGLEHNLIIDTKGYKQCLVDKRVESFNPLCIRKLTPREYSRLQGYPDSFTFTCSRSSAYALIATSVCIPVIRAIIMTVFRALCKLYVQYVQSSIAMREYSFSSNKITAENLKFLQQCFRNRPPCSYIDHMLSQILNEPFDDKKCS